MKKMRSIALIMTMILSILTFVSCGNTTQETSSTAKPTKGYIWEAKKGEDTVYLVGTMHPAPPDVNFFNDKINDIIKKTDTVALEIDLTDTANLKELENYQKKNYFLKSGELKNLLSAEEFEKLKTILKDYNLKYENIKLLTPPGVIEIINAATYNIAGYTGEVFDIQLAKKYKELNKKVISLETVEEQLNILSSDVDINILKEFINKYDKKLAIDDNIEMLKTLFKGYETGDNEIAEKDLARYKDDKELYDKLILNRNINMVEKIDKMVQEKKKFMVAVGCLHFFGEDSIIKLLEEKAYEIKAIA